LAPEIFAEVECAFWKEEPNLRDAIFLFDFESGRQAYARPNFINEGFQRTQKRARIESPPLTANGAHN